MPECQLGDNAISGLKLASWTTNAGVQDEFTASEIATYPEPNSGAFYQKLTSPPRLEYPQCQRPWRRDAEVVAPP